MENNKEEMPLGLGFGLAMNDVAMEHFSNLSDDEKKQVMDTARTVSRLSRLFIFSLWAAQQAQTR